MSYTKTFTATQYASSIYEGTTVYNRFRIGMPADDGKIESYRAYRSLAWFNKTEVAAFLNNRIATEVKVKIVSLGETAESADPCPVRLYRTDLAYDGSKAGWNSANTARPDTGMIYDQPQNAHFIQFWETDNLSKGGSVENVLCTGDDANTLAAAIAAGNAIGAWCLRPGTQMYVQQGSYRVRHMTISVTITAENNQFCSAPDTVTILDQEPKQGELMRIRVDGAQDGVGHPITGYAIKKRWKIAGENWSAWSSPEIVPGRAGTATIKTTLLYPGSTWQIAVASVSDVNTTDYVLALNMADVYMVRRNMISVFDQSATTFDTIGNATLIPISCEVSETAGGDYSLTMKHPIDDTGKWHFLAINNIIKVMVPATPTKQIDIGASAQIYQITERCEVYSEARIPTPITYGDWSYPAVRDAIIAASVPKRDPVQGETTTTSAVLPDYKCTYAGKNYQLKEVLFTLVSWSVSADGRWVGSPVNPKKGYNLFPSKSNPYYAETSSTTAGGKVLAKLAVGQNVYFVSEYNKSWLHVITLTGQEGYILSRCARYLRTIDTTKVEQKVVNDQLFRIYNTVIDDKARTVTVKALHVSYDHAGNMTQECKMTNMSAGAAIALIQSSLINDFSNNIATDLTEDDGLYTGDLSWTSMSNCILNKDKGLVDYYGAKLVRNNWDYFIYKKDKVNRGFVLKHGVNLKGIQWTEDTSRVITRVIPFAKGESGTDVMLDDLYVDSPIIDAYPVIYCSRLAVDGKIGDDDGTGGKWTEETLKAHLREKATEEFTVNNVDQPEISLKVDFVMLGDTAEYSQYKNLQHLYLYDWVTVEDSTLGLSYTVEVQKTVWDALNQRYTSITLGTGHDPSKHLISDNNLMNGSVAFDKIAPEAVNKILSLVGSQELRKEEVSR